MQEKKINGKTLLWLWLAIALACVLVFHTYILGNDALVFGDVGSDTKDQYIMWYSSIVNHLRSGDFSLWDFYNGLGSSAYNMNLTAPILLVVYLFGTIFGPEQIAGFMVYVMMGEILLAGTACYFFLSEYRFREYNKLAVSFIYAFNGYLMVWGQHYQMGAVLVYLPLLLLFIEKTVRNRRCALGAAFVSCLLILNGYYQGYMCMLGGGIYVALRVLLYENAPFKKRMADFLAIGSGMVLGVCMGAVNLLPSIAVQVGTTSRLSSETSLLGRVIEHLTLYPKEYYKTLVYRLFGSNLQNGPTGFDGYINYYEAIQLFFSTLFIILLLQYLFTIHRQKKTAMQKAAQYVGVLFAVFMVTIETGSLIFNGFAYEFSRQTFLLMPVFALLSASVLERILEEKKLCRPALLLAVGLMVVVYASAYRHMDGAYDKNNAMIMFLTGLAMAGALLAYTWKKTDQKLCCQILLLALFVNVVSDTMVCFQNRDTVKKNDIVFYGQTFHGSVQEALAYIEEQDDSFYRVEKDFQTASICLDSLVQQYRGVSTYSSVQNKYIIPFVNKLWRQLKTGYDNNHYRFLNSVREQDMAALTGVKYVLSREPEFKVEGYEFFAQVGEIYIYRNTETDSIGKFFTKTVTQAEFEEQNHLDTWDLLKEVLIVEEEDGYTISQEELQEYAGQKIDLLDMEALDEEYLRDDGTLEAVDNHFIYLPLKSAELQKYDTVWVEMTIETDMGTELQFRMNDETHSHICYHKKGKKKYIFAVPSDTQEITVQVTNSGMTAQITKLTFYAGDETAFSDEAEIRIDDPQKDTYLTGSIHAGTDGVAMLAIPYENGWSVYLNGEKQTLKSGDYGFIAFDVAAGDYELEVVYKAPMFKEGLIISLVSCLLFVVIWICSKKKREGLTNDRV